MPNEILAALIGFGVIAIGTAGALLQFIPKYVARQVALKDRERQQVLDDEKMEREARMAELSARIEESKSLVAQIAKGNEIQERLIDRIVDIAQEQSTNNKVVQANTNALTGNTEAIGDLEKTVSSVDTRLGQVETTVSALKGEIAELNRQIKEWLNDNEKCADADAKVTEIQKQIDDLVKIYKQPVNAVAVNVIPQATTLTDDGGAAKEKSA